MNEERNYTNYIGEEIKIRYSSYPKVIEILKRDLPPPRDVLWHSFE